MPAAFAQMVTYSAFRVTLHISCYGMWWTGKFRTCFAMSWFGQACCASSRPCQGFAWLGASAWDALSLDTIKKAEVSFLSAGSFVWASLGLIPVLTVQPKSVIEKWNFEPIYSTKMLALGSRKERNLWGSLFVVHYFDLLPHHSCWLSYSLRHLTFSGKSFL